MFETFEERYLSDSCARYTIIFFFKSDFLESNILSSYFILGLVDHSVSSFSQFLKLLVLIYMCCWFCERLRVRSRVTSCSVSGLAIGLICRVSVVIRVKVFHFYY
jgi:hypothetical protein